MVTAAFPCHVPTVVTGHSLGRNKLQNLIKTGKMTRAEAEAQYRIFRRIEAEERALETADLIVCRCTHMLHAACCRSLLHFCCTTLLLPHRCIAAPLHCVSSLPRIHTLRV